MRNCLRNVRLIVLLLPMTGWIVSKGSHSKVNSSDRAGSPMEASVSIRGLEKPDHAAQARVTETYGKLPLSFEANRGQTDSEVKFFSRGSGYGIFITPTEAVLSLSSGSQLRAKCLRRGRDAVRFSAAS